MSLLKNGIVISKRNFLLNLLLFSIFFTLYFVFSSIITKFVIQLPNDRLIVQASFCFVVAATLTMSSFVVYRINKLVRTYLAPTAIILFTILLYLFPNNIVSIAILFAAGIFLSIGLMSFLMYFWETTVPEERGRISGFIGFVALPSNFAVAYLVAPSLDFLSAAVVSIIFSSVVIAIAPLQTKPSVTAKKKEKWSYSEKRTILLYSIPWVVFSLVNVTFAKNASASISLQIAPSSYLLILGLQFVGVIFGCIIGGTVADFYGRKLSLALSLTSYGISTVLIGILDNINVIAFAYVLNGLSWGVLFTLYIFVVWGDLANGENCARVYSIGIAIYYLSSGVGLIMQISFPVVIGSLFTCMLVFLSILPIMLAPELLSPYFRERLRIKQHMKAIKKIGRKSKD